MNTTSLVSAVAASVISLLCFSGCQNRYSSTYVPSIGPSAQLAPYSGHTDILQSANLRGDVGRLVRQNYVILGHSSFETTDWVPDSVRLHEIQTQATRVGADIVLTKKSYQGIKQASAYYPGLLDQTTSSDPTVSPSFVGKDEAVSEELDKYSAVYLRKPVAAAADLSKTMGTLLGNP